MSDDKPITMEICEFLDNCPLDGFIEKFHNTELIVEDASILRRPSQRSN